MDNEIAKLKDELVGALVGMARAADAGDLPDRAVAVAVEGLALSRPDIPADAEALRALIARAHEEKYALSPGCRDCAHPCQRTADFDLRELQLERSEALRALKLRLLDALRNLAASVLKAREAGARDAEAEGYFCDGLMDLAHAYEEARLRRTIARAEALQARLEG